MRTRLVVDVGAWERYVVARHYGAGRGRATRAEIRRFAAAALERLARDVADDLAPRQRNVAARLRAGRPQPEPEAVRRSGLRQPALFP